MRKKEERQIREQMGQYMGDGRRGEKRGEIEEEIRIFMRGIDMKCEDKSIRPSLHNFGLIAVLLQS